MEAHYKRQSSLSCLRIISFLDSILAARKKYNGEMFPILGGVFRFVFTCFLLKLYFFTYAFNHTRVIVSQDCGHAPTLDVIKQYSNNEKFLQYIEQTDRTEPWNVKKNMLG